jgi:hypothetical protein
MKTKLLLVVAGLGLLVGLDIATRPGRGRAQELTDANPAASEGTQAPADPNRDVLVTPDQGKWLICVISYTGPEAPGLARQMVDELRGPNFGLPAFVFNYGAEAKRKEQERAKGIILKQKEMLRELHMDSPTKVYARTMHIEEECAVLVGGYRDMEAARRALDELRKKAPPAPNRVKLATRVFVNPDETEGEIHAVNPFQTAFVVRNPSLAPEPDQGKGKLDVAALRRLNAGEAFSLLNCPKPLTLVVANYSLPGPLQQPQKPNSFWNKFGVGNKAKEGGDPAALPAHSLAEGLRKCHWEAYVLHTKYGSIVTVGGYDSLQDPRLIQARERLSRLSYSLREHKMLALFSQPMPMEVPR